MVNTRHINKNGLSFDCPDYYDIGKYPSSDEAHKSMVALSKHDREYLKNVRTIWSYSKQAS